MCCFKISYILLTFKPLSCGSYYMYLLLEPLSVQCRVKFDSVFRCLGPESSLNRHVILECCVFVVPNLLLSMAAFRSCRLQSFLKINFDKIIGIHNDNLYRKGRYFVFAKHCREKFYSIQKGIYCLCRLTESF